MELFDIRKDPYCLTNLAQQPAHKATRDKMEKQLKDYLTKTNDPRLVADGEKIYESYIRYSPIRKYPEPK